MRSWSSRESRLEEKRPGPAEREDKLVANPIVAAVEKACSLSHYCLPKDLFWYYNESGSPALMFRSSEPSLRLVVEVVFPLSMSPLELPEISIRDGIQTVRVLEPDPEDRSRGAEELGSRVRDLKASIELHVMRRLQWAIAEFHSELTAPKAETQPEKDSEDFRDTETSTDTLASEQEQKEANANAEAGTPPSFIPELDGKWYYPRNLAATAMHLLYEAEWRMARFLTTSPFPFRMFSPEAPEFLDARFRDVYALNLKPELDMSKMRAGFALLENTPAVLENYKWWGRQPEGFFCLYKDVFLNLRLFEGSTSGPFEETEVLRLYASHGPYEECLEVPLLMPLFIDLRHLSSRGKISDEFPPEISARCRWEQQ